MRAGDAAAPFVSWPTRAKLLNHIRLSSQARCTLPMASCDLGLPGRIMLGLKIQIHIEEMMRGTFNRKRWGIMRANKGYFLIPDIIELAVIRLFLFLQPFVWCAVMTILRFLNGKSAK
jgi:hypothetical protein